MKATIQDTGSGTYYAEINHKMGSFEVQLHNGKHYPDCLIYLDNEEFDWGDKDYSDLESDLITAAEDAWGEFDT